MDENDSYLNEVKNKAKRLLRNQRFEKFMLILMSYIILSYVFAIFLLPIYYLLEIVVPFIENPFLGVPLCSFISFLVTLLVFKFLVKRFWSGLMKKQKNDLDAFKAAALDPFY